MGIIMRGDKPFGSVSKPINVDDKEVPRGNGGNWVESSKVFIKDVETTEGSIANPINLIEKVIETNFPARQDSFNAATIIKGVKAGTDTYEMTLRDDAEVNFAGTSFTNISEDGWLQNEAGYIQTSLSSNETSSCADTLNVRKYNYSKRNITGYYWDTYTWSNGWKNNAAVGTIQGPIARFAHNSTFLVEQGAAVKFAGSTQIVSDGQMDILLHGSPGDINDKGTANHFATAMVINPYAVIKADGGANGSNMGAPGCLLNLSNTKFQFIGCTQITDPINIPSSFWSDRYSAIDTFQNTIANIQLSNLWPPNGTQINYDPVVISPVLGALGFGPLVEIEGPTSINIGGYVGSGSSAPSIVDIDISGGSASSILIDTHIGSTALLNCHLGGRNGSKTILDITPDTSSSLRIKAGGSEGSVLNYEFLGGQSSKVWYLIDADNGGKVQYMIKGNDLFHQEANNSHFEIMDDAIFIMSSQSYADRTHGTGAGHLSKNWQSPMTAMQHSPILQMHDGAMLYMRGELGSGVTPTHPAADGNNPIIEVVDQSELRLCDGSKISMMEDSTDNTIKVKFDDGTDSVTFTIAQLKALKALI